MVKIFLDSNVLLYGISEDSLKSEKCFSLIDNEPTISTQVLNEVVRVARKKYAFSFEQIEVYFEPIKAACEIVAINLETHTLAFEIAKRTSLNIFDANIVASAQLAGCDVLYTENLNDGQRIGAVTIRNPFN